MTLTTTVDGRLLLTAARLLDDLEGQRRREAEAYAAGYRDGHRSGWEIGYAHAHEEMAAHWRALAEQIRRTANTPTHAELIQRRATSTSSNDYAGGPVEWEGPRTKGQE